MYMYSPHTHVLECIGMKLKLSPPQYIWSEVNICGPKHDVVGV